MMRKFELIYNMIEHIIKKDPFKKVVKRVFQVLEKEGCEDIKDIIGGGRFV